MYAGLVALALLVRLPNITGILDLDSIEYVRAARMGYVVNAFDVGSRPIKSFLLAGARAFMGDGDVHVWREDMNNNDVAAFRHYHPPVHVYMLSAWMSLFGSSNAALMLLPTLLGAVLAPALYWAWRTLFPAESRLPGLWAALFVVFDPLLAHTGKFVAHHMFFILTTFVALVVLARAFRDGSTRDFLVFAVLLGVLFATLEYALVVCASAVLALLVLPNPWLALNRQGVAVSYKLLAAAGAAVVAFALLWPAGILKLNVLKGYAILSAMGVQEASEFPLQTVLGEFFLESPVMILFCLIGLGLLARRIFSGPASLWLLTLALFPTIVLAINLRNAIAKPVYLSVILPYLILLAGWALWVVASRWTRRPVIACAVVVAVCALANAPALAKAGAHAFPFWPQVFEFFDQHARPGDRVLVSNVVDPVVLAYYKPQLKVDRGYGWESAIQETLAAIRNRDYRFLMLVNYPAPPGTGTDLRRPVKELPYYPLVEDLYRLAATIRNEGEDVSVLLYEPKNR